MTVTGPVALGEQVSYRSYDYVALLRRRWWILALGIVLGGIAGLGAAKLVPKAYTSETSVLVGQSSVADQSSARNTTGTGVNVDNEAQLVTSSNVGVIAQKLLKTSTPVPTLVQNVTVTVPANTAILTISCEASKPKLAQACSGAFAAAYIQYRTQTATQQLNTQQASLKTQIATLNAEVAQVAAQLVDLPTSSPKYAVAFAQRQVLVQELQSQSLQLQTLEAPITPPAVPISGASLPTSPSKPVKVLYLASGVMVGLLIALLLAVFLQRMDRRVHNARSLRNSRVPVLSDISMGGRRRPLSLVNASMNGAHSFGLLSNVVLARLERGGHLVLGVVGVKPGSAASVVAASLSDSLAGGGRRVVHIVADPSSNTPSLLGAPKGPGLADVLEHPEPDAIEHLPGWGSPFQVINPGRASDKLGRWLGSDAMNRIIARVREHADLVVLEGSDLTTSADSYAVALTADATVVVVEADRTTIDEVDQALDQFARLGVPVLGLVLVAGLPGVHAATDPAPATVPISTKVVAATAAPVSGAQQAGPGDLPMETGNRAGPHGPATDAAAVDNNHAGSNHADVNPADSNAPVDNNHAVTTTNGKLGVTTAFDVLPGTARPSALGTDRPA